MGTASSDCLSWQIRVIHSSLFNPGGCTQKNEEPIFACGVIEKYADRTRLRGGVMAEGQRADLFGAFVTAMEDDFLATLASSFLDKSPLCLAYFGLDRRCRFANPNYRLTFGIDPATIATTTLADAMGPAIVDRLNGLEAGAVAGE